MMSDLELDHSPLTQRLMNPSNNNNNNKDCYSRLDVDSWRNRVKENKQKPFRVQRVTKEGLTSALLHPVCAQE